MANEDDMSVEIREASLRRVRRGLESAVDDAVKTKDLQALATRIQNMILLRTQRGYYLDGDGGKEKRRYQSQSWKAKRASRGLTTSHVTLFFGEGQLLESMVARGRMTAGKPTIEVGYFSGLSESKAMEIARYMNKEGIGTSKVKYPYVGLTDDERETAVEFLRGRLGQNLDRNL